MSFGIGVVAPSLLLAQVRPSDGNTVHLIFWFSKSDPERTFTCRVYDDRNIPETRKIPDSKRGYVQSRYEDIARQAGKGPDGQVPDDFVSYTQAMPLGPVGFGSDEQQSLADQAKVQAHVETLKKWALSKKLPFKFQNLKPVTVNPLPAKRPKAKAETQGFAYKPDAQKHVGIQDLAGTRWHEKASYSDGATTSVIVSFQPGGRFQIKFTDGSAYAGTWKQEKDVLSRKLDNGLGEESLKIVDQGTTMKGTVIKNTYNRSATYEFTKQ